MSFKFVDLFCGMGGFHRALQNLGGECVLASDIDKNCQDSYERNFGMRPFGDIYQLKVEDIPDHDVLCGGFPCQDEVHSKIHEGRSSTKSQGL